MKTYQEMPGSAYAAFLQGNTLLPQHNIGTSALTAKAMVDAYLESQTNGVALWQARDLVSDSQVNKATVTMRILHARYGIDCGAMSDSIKPRVRHLMNGAIHTAQDTVKGFTDKQLRNEFRELSYMPHDQIGEFLFERDASGQLFRPEILALQSMLKLTKEAMFSKEGLAAMREYRDDILEIGDRNSGAFNLARMKARLGLYGIVNESLQESLLQIETATGVALNEETINTALSINGLSPKGFLPASTNSTAK